jgi:hypothetical protein
MGERYPVDPVFEDIKHKFVGSEAVRRRLQHVAAEARFPRIHEPLRKLPKP